MNGPDVTTETWPASCKGFLDPHAAETRIGLTTERLCLAGLVKTMRDTHGSHLKVGADVAKMATINRTMQALAWPGSRKTRSMRPHFLNGI